MPYLTRTTGRRECLACGVHTYQAGPCRNCGGITTPTVECVDDQRPPNGLARPLRRLPLRTESPRRA